ncbi:hypothetical protein [Massilia sp. DWR3-1-1]|uniref:hypothetical protein n=1 Tax=Massilia sp. DWR3-1-1 TaxID=2804559 RepID=UPI003CF5895B
MTIEMQSERRSGDRRRDGFTAKILHAVFAMRRGFGSAAAKNLLLRNGHDDDFIAQALSIPGERRGQRRRSDAAPPAHTDPAVTPERTDQVALTLDAAGMAVLHRLRFEADSGMHRLTMVDCPADLKRFGLIEFAQDGTATITGKGRQALKHFACVRALDNIWRGLDAIPVSDEIRAWLESNLFLLRDGSGSRYALTELGKRWLEFNRSLSHH